jgi:hypothetical protein
MSDFDEKDIHKDVTAQYKGDFDPADIHKELPAQISKMESFGKGVQQGATLGNADEIQGAIPAGMDKIQSLLASLGLLSKSPSDVNSELAAKGFTGDLGPQDSTEMYQQARDSSRKDYNAASAANPLSSLAGNAIGSALTLGMAPARLVSPMGAAPEGAGILQAMTTGAANAAPVAAIAGSGMSNSDLTKGDIGGYAEDVAKDTALGAGVGAALPAISTVGKSVANGISQSKTMQDVLEAYRAGKDKLKLSDPETMKNLRDSLKSSAADASDKIQSTIQNLFKQKSDILSNLEDTGVKSNVKDVLQTFADQANGSIGVMRPEENQMINDAIAKTMIGGNERSPQELENLIATFKDLKANVNTPTGMKSVNNAVQGLQQIQNNLDPQLQQINNKAFQTIDAAEALTGKNPLDYLNGKKDLAMDNTLANKLEQQGNYKVSSDLGDILDNGLQTSKNAKISPLSELVPDAAQGIKNTAQDATRLDLAKRMQGETGKGFWAGISDAVMTSAPKLSNATGRAVENNTNFLQQGISKLSSATPDSIQELSSRMAATGGAAGKQFANVLSESLNKNGQSRNAIIFGLMQDPTFRALFHDANGTHDNEDTGK